METVLGITAGMLFILNICSSLSVSDIYGNITVIASELEIIKRKAVLPHYSWKWRSWLRNRRKHRSHRTSFPSNNLNPFKTLTFLREASWVKKTENPSPKRVEPYTSINIEESNLSTNTELDCRHPLSRIKCALTPAESTLTLTIGRQTNEKFVDGSISSTSPLINFAASFIWNNKRMAYRCGQIRWKGN